MDKGKLKNYLIIITYGIVLFIVLMHFSHVLRLLGIVYKVFIPVIYGLIIAFLINIPYEFFRSKVFKSLSDKGKKHAKAAVIISLIATYVVLLAALAFLFRFIIPQIVNSITQLIQNIPLYFSSLESYLNRVVEYWGVENFVSQQVQKIWVDFNNNANDILADLLPRVVNYLLSFTSGLFNWIIGLAISIYLLATKENLMRQSTMLLRAFGPQRYYDRIMELFTRANYIFRQFIAGDLIDSLIVGGVCFIGTSILQMPYAFLVSVIVGVTNLIPIFGPFIGAIPSIFIILMVEPYKSLVFLIFILILQQVDGNLIKPRVFGSTLGLPGMWVLISILVGGGLFGVLGMLLAVPTFALIYSILREETNARIKKQEEK